MTSLLFRVKASWNPREIWRDIEIGVNRSLVDLQVAINTSFELMSGHLWFFSKDRDYWQSKIKYVCPLELKYPSPLDDYLDMFQPRREERHNAADVTLGELDLSKGDRLYYLYDYGDEWRFYMILKKVMEDGESELEPVVLKGKGEIFEYMYDEEWDEH
jgi:hypothetical protein